MQYKLNKLSYNKKIPSIFLTVIDFYSFNNITLFNEDNFENK